MLFDRSLRRNILAGCRPDFCKLLWVKSFWFTITLLYAPVSFTTYPQTHPTHSIKQSCQIGLLLIWALVRGSNITNNNNNNNICVYPDQIWAVTPQIWATQDWIWAFQGPSCAVSSPNCPPVKGVVPRHQGWFSKECPLSRRPWGPPRDLCNPEVLLPIRCPYEESPPRCHPWRPFRRETVAVAGVSIRGRRCTAGCLGKWRVRRREREVACLCLVCRRICSSNKWEIHVLRITNYRNNPYHNNNSNNQSHLNISC